MSLPEVCVVYLIREIAGESEVLLGRKLTGLGKGKVVAPGGKLEGEESPRTAAVRELWEEAGIRAQQVELEPIGELTYLFPTRPSWSQRSWAFLARGAFGDAQKSAELESWWTPIKRIPFDEMWDDARYWLPSALGGTPVTATFEFGADLATVTTSNYPLFGRSHG